MKIFEWFRFRKARKLFPKIEKDYWAACCAGWNEKNTDEVFPYWIKNDRGKNDYNNLTVGCVVPVYARKGYVAFYVILGWSKGYWYDGAGWDDGRKYSLKLHHIEKDTGIYKPYIK